MNNLLIHILPAFRARLTPILAPMIKLIAKIIPNKKSIFMLTKKTKNATIESILTMNVVVPAPLIKPTPNNETNINVNIVEIPAP